MDELAIPDDVAALTPGRMIEDLESLAIRAETASLTDAERTYRRSLRQKLRERAQD